MKQQAMNPYLPSYEYIPDAEPHIFDGRVYIYGSHDRFNGISFCLNDYVCWSAPVEDLSDWRYEGVIYRKEQDGKNYHSFLNSMFAPDVCRGRDGRYYLYYFIGYNSLISVAVCDKPAGKYDTDGDGNSSGGNQTADSIRSGHYYTSGQIAGPEQTGSGNRRDTWLCRRADYHTAALCL